jgi:hypothetical protein
VYTELFLSALILAGELAACGGEIRDVEASCVVAQCPSLVGMRLSTPSDGGVASFCGQPASAGDGYVILFDPEGNCVCQMDEAGVFTACKVVTRRECEAQPTCGSCNATPACAWCRGSTRNPQPFCDFRPALDCVGSQGTLATPDCSQ